MALFSWQNWIRKISGGQPATAKRRKQPVCNLGVEALEERTLLSATALIRDINAVGDRDGVARAQGYYDNGPTKVGGFLYFIGNDGMHGNELWKSDGTEAGTTLVADLTAGPADSEFFSLTAAGDRLYFIFDDGVHGHEVWSTDGTAAGTAMVKDISPDGDSLYYETPSLVAVGNTVFFMASDIVHGQELWKTNGTEASTKMVADLTPGQDPLGVGYYSKMYGLTASGGKLYFIFDDGIHGSELWMSDGTEDGTQMVLDINPTGGGVQPSDEDARTGLVDLNGTLYFQADNTIHGQELWKTNGTAETTVLVADLTEGEYEPGVGYGSVVYGMTAAGNQIYFVFDDGIHGYELWTSDGSEEGTVLLKDFNPTGNGVDTNYARVTASGGLVYFLAKDGVHGTELWKTDGTPSNTSMVADLTVDDDSEIYDLTDVNGTLFFVFDDGDHDFELWSTDGSLGGTAIVKDINPSGEGAYPSDSYYYATTLVNLNGTLLFHGNDGVHGFELWRSDNTENGTVMVKNINQAGHGSVDTSFLTFDGTAQIGDTLYFVANDGIHGDELWKSDGTEAGTVMVADLTDGPGGSSISGLTAFNGQVMFVFGDPVHSYELWKTDGTAVGTSLVKDINPNGLGIYSGTKFLEMDGELYFLANDGPHGMELWKTNGTEAGTVLVEDLATGDIIPGHGRSSYLTNLTEFDGRIYFVYDDGNHGSELWSTDGSHPAAMLMDIGPNPRIESLTAVDDTLYFLANDGVHGQELWATDGTEIGTRMVADLIPGNTNPPSYSNPFFADLTASNGQLFFVLNKPGSGRELWVSNGTGAGTHLVKDINPNGDGFPYTRGSELTDVDGVLYFAANDGVHGLALWKSNGTDAGTEMVADLPATDVRRLHSLTNIAGQLYFTFDDGVHGRELWTSNGTSAGTVMVQDINPYGNSVEDYDAGLIDVNGTLFFPAEDGVHGIEFWSNKVPLTLEGANFQAYEHSPASTVVGTVTAAGGNAGAVLVYSLVSQTVPGAFAIDPANGQITVANASLIDFVTQPNHTLTVLVSDDSAPTHTAQATVLISLLDVNAAPSFSIPSQLTVLEDASQTSYPGFATSISAGPSNESGQALTFDVQTDNPGLFTAPPTITASGQLSFFLAANANGTAHFAVTLRDNGGTAHNGANTSPQQSFTLNVTAVNDVPAFTLSGDRSVIEDVPAQTVENFATSLSAGPADESDQTLQFQVTNNNPSLFAVAPIISSTGVLTYTLAANANGSATVTVKLQDSGGTDAGGVNITEAQTFNIQVSAVNDVPSFQIGENQTALEDATVAPLAGFISSISAGATDEANQTLTFMVENDNSALFLTPPAISSNGTLTYTLAPNANGSATVTVRLQDNGDGTNTSAPQTFTITVTPVNDAPAFTLGADQILLEDSPAQTIPAFAAGLSKGPANESDQVLTFALVADNPDLFSSQPAISSTGELTYTLAPNANGAAHITVTLKDNGGTAHSGADSAPDASFTITVTPVNDAPEFGLGANLILAEDSPAQSVPGFASALSKGPANESEQALTFTLATDNPGLFSTQPAISSTGELTYTLAPNANGVAHITVSLKDNGGTANGGADSAPDAAFTIEATPVDDPIVFNPEPEEPTDVGVGGRTLIDPGLTIGDPDNPVAVGGSKLTVTLGGTIGKTDLLSLPSKKAAINGISVKGKNVFLGTQVIATVEGGSKKAPLIVTFASNTTEAAVTAVLRSIGFSTKGKKVPTGTRTVNIKLENANGQLIAATTREIEVDAA